MRHDSSGTNELLNFLRGETHTGVDWTKDVDVSTTKSSHQLTGGKNLAVQQVSYELSGLAGQKTSDTIVLEENGTQYTFKNVIPVNRDEAIAETLEITQL